MKQSLWIWYLLSLCFVMIGIVFHTWLNVLDILLVFSGVALFLFTFWRHCISKAKRCPNCNAVIHSGHVRTISRQENGMIRCETCGSLVCVNHAVRK